MPRICKNCRIEYTGMFCPNCEQFGKLVKNLKMSNASLKNANLAMKSKIEIFKKENDNLKEIIEMIKNGG